MPSIAPSAAWVDLIKLDWPRLLTTFQGAPAPQAEQVRLLNSDLVEATVRWEDGGSGKSYESRRWYRLEGNQWQWTQPRPASGPANGREDLPNLTLTFHRDDGDIVGPIMAELDALASSRCQEFGVPADACHFYLRWERLDQHGQPFRWQDAPLPTLAAGVADELDGPIYLANLRRSDWRSPALRARLQRFYPGRGSVAQNQLSVVRPVDSVSLPDALTGEAADPLLMPTPWLAGIDDSGMPHPRWMAYADRALTDLVLRKARGYSLGSARSINAVWALHQALLASATGLPEVDALAAQPGAAPPSTVHVGVPDLSGLGAILQTDPDATALAQLAGLVGYLETNWSAAELASLASAMAQTSNPDRLLAASLGVGADVFLDGWRAAERQRAGSPLAELVEQLEEHARTEARLAQTIDQQAVLRLYTDSGRAWLESHSPDSGLFAQPQFGNNWSVSIGEIGGLGDTVWAVVDASDGINKQRDIRFYRWNQELGWLRERPLARFWGANRTLESGLITWLYPEIDDEVVQAAALLLDASTRATQQAFGLPVEPVRITLVADTRASFAGTDRQGNLLAASPQSYVAPVDADALEAFRRDIATRIVQQQSQRLFESLSVETLPLDQQWQIGLAATGMILAQFEALGLDDSNIGAVVRQAALDALSDGSLPPAQEIAAASARDDGDGEANYHNLALTAYLYLNHGMERMATVIDSGLEEGLKQVMAEKGWTWGDLDADWRAYLASQ